jgi:hypothetical protein
MRGRTSLLAIPSLAITVVGVAMFGPGAVQPFDGARIRGGPYAGNSLLSWRIHVLQRCRSIDSSRSIGQITVHAHDSAGQEASAASYTWDDGTADVALDFGQVVTAPIHAVVTAEATGATLAEGDLDEDLAHWGEAPGHSTRVQGAKSGDLSVDVDAQRGIFAARFRDELIVSVRDGEESILGAEVIVYSDAADIDRGKFRGKINDAGPKVTQRTSSDGRAIFGVTPRSDAVHIDIDVRWKERKRATFFGPGDGSLGAIGSLPDTGANGKERKAAWHGVLPVVPGAMWLDPASSRDAVRIVSAVPREFISVSFAAPTIRYWGTHIRLTQGADGFASGEIPWPGKKQAMDAPVPQQGWLTVASDPLASGAGTVGWPIAGRALAGERPFRDQLLLDGMPDAEKRDRGRRYRARLLSAAALGAATVLGAVLLARNGRASSLRAWEWTAIAIATVVLAFVAIGLLVMWKTSGWP